METKIKAIVSYRGVVVRKDGSVRRETTAVEIDAIVSTPCTLRQIGEQIRGNVAWAAAMNYLPHADWFADGMGDYAHKLAAEIVRQVCVYHRGSFIGSLTPARS